ncbi:hypothetical protein EYF80_012536 [Liparis tanakae]|uniref:Uncharacterized protein n=1 Tax=Liparis tanakae TaxID=230148 RepID=A0A4Z2IGS3_9TELE|nr:hypothetical protein EYF80_012536 [Liparis tanakae]
MESVISPMSPAFRSLLSPVELFPLEKRKCRFHSGILGIDASPPSRPKRQPERVGKQAFDPPPSKLFDNLEEESLQHSLKA